jgi:drug/metabolite transporter (DMT)-like permease
MPRPLVLGLYAVLVVVWSSTWVAIKFGLEDTPPLLGAGVRFVLAGAVLLAVAVAQRRVLHTDWRLAALLALLPFAAAYGLIYWAEQYITSGLAAVLFGVMPLYVAMMATGLLPEERIDRRLIFGVAVAIGGLVVAFGEAINLGSERALLGALAVLAAPLASASGTIAVKLRAARLDAIVLNGWAMLGGGAALLVVSGPIESWGEAVWSAQAFAAIGYLALPGSALTFVLLTLLLRELPAVTMSYLPLLLPFGALLFGAALYDEPLTGPAVLGGALVAAGLLVAQWRGRAAG